jgi:hypothetical protein
VGKTYTAKLNRDFFKPTKPMVKIGRYRIYVIRGWRWSFYRPCSESAKSVIEWELQLGWVLVCKQGLSWDKVFADFKKWGGIE